MEVIFDPSDLPARGDFDVIAGWCPERTAKVIGIENLNEVALYNALHNLVDAGQLPAVGSAHGRVVNATLSGYSVEAIPPDMMAVRMRYRQVMPAFSEDQQQQQLITPTLRFSATLGQIQTNLDINGKVIEVEWEGKRQSGLITRMIPNMAIDISRMEIGSPKARIKPLIGKYNEKGWRVCPEDPAETWLFAGVHGTSVDLGFSYRCDYQFLYREPNGPYSGWDEEVVFIDPETGRPPPDAYESPALIRVPNYRRANFNLLGFA